MSKKFEGIFSPKTGQLYVSSNSEHFKPEKNSAVSKNPDQLAEVSASFAEVSAVHSQKLPRFTHGNSHEISNRFQLVQILLNE